IAAQRLTSWHDRCGNDKRAPTATRLLIGSGQWSRECWPAAAAPRPQGSFANPTTLDPVEPAERIRLPVGVVSVAWLRHVASMQADPALQVPSAVAQSTAGPGKWLHLLNRAGRHRS